MDGGSSSKRKAESQREGESSGKRLSVTVGLEHLDCPICSKPLRPPILQCSVGHFICSSCCKYQLQADSKCHLCSEETSFERCFGMEHVVQSVTVACSNEKYGCAETFTYYKKEEHKKACQYAPCFCPESGCGFAGPTKVLLDHFTTQHKCPLTTLSDSGTVSLCIQPGLHVLQCTGNSYFFLLSMATEPFGHVISVICIQPNMTESKFTCNLSYDCIITGYCGSTSCYIRSSSLFDGLPSVYDLILPKGKDSDDANCIMLRATINHQILSHDRSCFRGKAPTSALQQTHGTYDKDDQDEKYTPKSCRRSHPAKEEDEENDGEEEEVEEDEENDGEEEEVEEDEENDGEEEEVEEDEENDGEEEEVEEDEENDGEEEEEDERPLSLRRSQPAVLRRPNTYDDDGHVLEDEEDARPVNVSGPPLRGIAPTPAVQQRHYSDTDDEDDTPLSFSRSRHRGTAPAPGVQERYYFDPSDEDDIPIPYRINIGARALPRAV